MSIPDFHFHFPFPRLLLLPLLSHLCPLSSKIFKLYWPPTPRAFSSMITWAQSQLSQKALICLCFLFNRCPLLLGFSTASLNLTPTSHSGLVPVFPFLAFLLPLTSLTTGPVILPTCPLHQPMFFLFRPALFLGDWHLWTASPRIPAHQPTPGLSQRKILAGVWRSREKIS